MVLIWESYCFISHKTMTKTHNANAVTSCKHTHKQRRAKPNTPFVAINTHLHKIFAVENKLCVYMLPFWFFIMNCYEWDTVQQFNCHITHLLVYIFSDFHSNSSSKYIHNPLKSHRLANLLQKSFPCIQRGNLQSHIQLFAYISRN